MERYINSGIQQIGLGVADVEKGWKWIRKNFGLDVPIFQDAAEAPLMTKYTGETVHKRTATLAVNLMGGGGFEIWQYTSRDPENAPFEIVLGDTGIFAAVTKTPNINAAYQYISSNGTAMLGNITESPRGTPRFYVSDEGGNVFQVTESDDFFMRKPHKTGGVAGALIGVSNIETALPVYSDILGYDKTEYDEAGTFTDFAPLTGGEGKFRRVLLTHSKPRKGAFSRLLGETSIELVQSLDRKPKKIFENRLWGDLGFIHLCFDITGMEKLKQLCEEQGFPFTVDSADSFDMGEAQGHFSYIEDPDGTLIEFVETHKIPINKKKGKYLHLTGRDPEKPLANIMLKALRFGRVKD